MRRVNTLLAENRFEASAMTPAECIAVAARIGAICPRMEVVTFPAGTADHLIGLLILICTGEDGIRRYATSADPEAYPDAVGETDALRTMFKGGRSCEG
jgi:hypothetical protein